MTMANEVRLVRTDVLKEYFCAACSTRKRYKRTIEECRNTTDPYGNGCFKMRLIDNTPSTPESLRPVGRWELQEYDWSEAWKCSACGNEWCFVDDPTEPATKINYCPNCGAKMEG